MNEVNAFNKHFVPIASRMAFSEKELNIILPNILTVYLRNFSDINDQDKKLGKEGTNINYFSRNEMFAVICESLVKLAKILPGEVFAASTIKVIVAKLNELVADNFRQYGWAVFMVEHPQPANEYEKKLFELENFILAYKFAKISQRYHFTEKLSKTLCDSFKEKLQVIQIKHKDNDRLIKFSNRMSQKLGLDQLGLGTERFPFWKQPNRKSSQTQAITETDDNSKIDFFPNLD